MPPAFFTSVREETKNGQNRKTDDESNGSTVSGPDRLGLLFAVCEEAL
jgi:hypothetical protein